MRPFSNPTCLPSSYPFSYPRAYSGCLVFFGIRLPRTRVFPALKGAPHRASHHLLYTLYMLFSCHIGKYLCQCCVNIAVLGGMGGWGTDPFPSTTLLFYLWQRVEPKAAGVAPSDAFFPVTRRPGSQRRTGRVGFVNDFCSGSVFSLVRRAFCNRVEHTTAFPAARPGRKGTRKGRSYGDRAGHTSGPIRFRQQLSSSTSGSGLILESQG